MKRCTPAMPLNGKEIERRRGKRSMADCAAAAGWGANGFALWYQLESGKGPEDPQLSTVEAIARALGCTLNDIVTPRETPSESKPSPAKQPPAKPARGRGHRAPP